MKMFHVKKDGTSSVAKHLYTIHEMYNPQNKLINIFIRLITKFPIFQNALPIMPPLKIVC